MVGTAPAKVTRSCWIIVQSGSACRNRPGITKSAPANHPSYGNPQALAWNIGTIGSKRSFSVIPSTPFGNPPNACKTVERCEYATPFGSPVVPVV